MNEVINEIVSDVVEKYTNSFHESYALSYSCLTADSIVCVFNERPSAVYRRIDSIQVGDYLYSPCPRGFQIVTHVKKCLVHEGRRPICRLNQHAGVSRGTIPSEEQLTLMMLLLTVEISKKRNEHCSGRTMQ